MAAVPPRGEQRDGEQRDAHQADHDQARDRPVRDLRREQHVDDEQRHGEQVEQAVREDGAEQRRARTRAVRKVPAQHGDARELPGPRRQHGVAEQPDAERGEDMAEGGLRVGQRLTDRQMPRDRARTSTETRFSATPTRIQRQLTKSNAW